MNEKKVIPLFDPSDRGGNSRPRVNPQIYSIVVGNEIDHLALMVLMQKQITQGVMLQNQPIAADEPIYNKMIEPLKESEFKHHIGENAPIANERFIERRQKRGAFDRTGTSPGATLNKKRKWWER